jgi:hypothetical protein
LKTQQFWDRLAFDLAASTLWTPHHDFAVPNAFEGADAHRVTRPRRPRPNVSRANWRCRLAWQAVESRRFPSEPLPGWSGFPCPQNFRPQNHGAVSGDACDQIERKARPKKSTESSMSSAPEMLIQQSMWERAGGPKLARLRRRFAPSRFNAGPNVRKVETQHSLHTDGCPCADKIVCRGRQEDLIFGYSSISRWTGQRPHVK